MSWSVLINGEIIFKPNLTKKEVDSLIEEIQYILELDVKECKIDSFDRKTRLMFESLNWSSHVDGEKLKQVYEKIKDKTDFVSLELWYLERPDERIYKDERHKVEELELYC